MSEENNYNAAFDEAVAAVKNLRGGVKAFVLVAFAAEEDDDGNRRAVSAMSGKKIDIMELVSEAGKVVMKDIVLKDLLSEE